MAVYHVTIEMTAVHQLAIEAPDPVTAQGLALGVVGDRPAERVETNIEVERGAS